MPPFASQLADLPALNQVAVPDLWQQQAVTALREGCDVVVQAPTGAGKTMVFELWSNQGRNRGQAIYTVPTRALANDKLAEWRARGWDVGIATGDLAENLGAPVLVATLETQKNRLIQGAFRYGLLRRKGELQYDRVASALKRLALYHDTGNTEHLVDIANMMLLEYVEGRHPGRHRPAAAEMLRRAPAMGRPPGSPRPRRPPCRATR